MHLQENYLPYLKAHQLSFRTGGTRGSGPRQGKLWNHWETDNTCSGRLTLQNRRFIRKSIPLKPTITPSASPPATSQPADQRFNNTPHQPPSVQNNDVEMPPTVQQEMNTQLNPQQPMNSQQQVNTGSSNAKVHRSLKNLMSYNNPGRKDIPQWREGDVDC